MASLTIQMEAYAFRELVAHLQWRSDVQNIDLMNLAGFCRNCLAKWYHAGAKVYGVPMQYDEACERVYGEPYADWKKAHQKKATEEQMAIFESSKDRHAKTAPKLAMVGQALSPEAAGVGAAAGHSSVCGQTCDAPPPAPLPNPGEGIGEARIAVLTASDRASRGVYTDESGPAVVEMVKSFAERSRLLTPRIVHQQVVADDEDAIFTCLQSWSEAKDCDLIVTTGGTGFGPRDVTPEATRRIISRSAEGLSRAMAWQTSFQEPHSILSRGICGVTRNEVLVINLPGHPGAVKQCLSVLLPVLPRAIKMVKG
eukprot:TRINITY_DN25701_c0_g1_i1.p2 TRINITY_DN25701_c0_g1~~TRINITY_DN25701_c0_g1_i1.p2  ORF type:complete len:312 (+),score=54.82 TRINITY_DN25701_c0_g1_i1:48-983(+)